MKKRQGRDKEKMWERKRYGKGRRLKVEEDEKLKVKKLN